MGLFSRFSKSAQDGKNSEPVDSELFVIVDRSVDPHLVVYHDPRAILSEQYRHFRTNLLALNKDGSPKSVVFTSSHKGEGKSISVANIALSLVELGNTRVCLVDTDFRAPVLGKMFGIGEEPGLSDMLLEGLSLDKVLHQTKTENLRLICSGREPRNPTELLGSERMLDLASALKKDFQYILFDTPPIFPYSDACILGSRCNGIILVVRMDHTPKSTVEKAVKSAESAGGKVIGTFLTAIRPIGKEYTREYYYYKEST